VAGFESLLQSLKREICLYLIYTSAEHAGVNPYLINSRVFSWFRAGLNRGANRVNRIEPSSCPPGKAEPLLLFPRFPIIFPGIREILK
jgi:hypothetical protein